MPLLASRTLLYESSRTLSFSLLPWPSRPCSGPCRGRPCAGRCSPLRCRACPRSTALPSAVQKPQPRELLPASVSYGDALPPTVLKTPDSVVGDAGHLLQLSEREHPISPQFLQPLYVDLHARYFALLLSQDTTTICT